MFNKGTEQKLEFPFTEAFVANLKPSRLVNPRIGKFHNLKVPTGFDIKESTQEILEVRLMVEKGILPLEFLEKYYPYEGEFPTAIPDALESEGLSFMNPQGLADVVHMDMPSQAPTAILRYLLQSGANVKDWKAGHINFLESVPYAQENMLDGIKRGLDKAFDAKYYFGVARPEEISDCGKLMTAYPEGCPNHPSFPAGHGAAVAGGAKRVIDSFEKLSDEQLKKVLDTCYIWAMARSLAGVHHAIDNVAGLIVGGLGKYFRKDVLETYTQ